MIRLEGGFWGRGKCPICKRSYQKDLRLIWLWDDEKKEVYEHSIILLCSWCWIGLYAEMRQALGDVEVAWQNEKRSHPPVF